MKNKIVVGLYIRVSTQEQAKEGYSIGEQKERLEKYADANDWIVYKIYSDPGYSGGSMDRPGLKTLIQDAGSGKIDKVVVYKLDRLSRSQKDTLYLIEDIFLDNNVDFVSMTENFDTGTPLGRAMIGILSVFAQLEREQIKERMSVGREGRAKSGLWGGGSNVPIGYRYANNKLTIDPYEADMVRRIYREYVSGKTITSIWSELRDEGVTTSYGKPTRTTVRQILTRAIYAGMIKFNDQLFTGDHEAIVDMDTWKKARDLIKESARTDIKHLSFNNRVSPITGICFCGKCGKKMISRYWTQHSTGEVHKNIVCPGHKQRGYKGGVYKRSEIEDIVLGEIRKLKIDPDQLEEARSQHSETDGSERLAICEERIQVNKDRISKYMDLYTVDGIDLEVIKEKIKDLTTESESLKREIEEIKRKQLEEISEEDILAQVDQLENYIDLEDVDRTRKVITTLIKKVVLEDDNITIHWAF